MKKPEEVDFSDSSDEEFEVDEDADSDEALQEAFAAGKLKPGLVVVNTTGRELEKQKPAAAINDIPLIQHHLEKIKLPKKFGWIERLDIVNNVAPLAPEIALQLDEHKGKRSREIKSINSQRRSKGTASPSVKSVDDDPVHNDFAREMGFYRQAQEAVLKCLPRLREMGVPTRRPEDYFAEMAKSDTHMQKVAQVLLKKQTSTEKAEKVRKLREQKKFAKQTQVQVIQERQKAKKDMIESVKKYRKGQQGGNLDFLEEKKKGTRDLGKNRGGGRGDDKKRVNYRRQNKNEKYGNGGKKKGQKWNTRDSLDNFESGSGGKGKGSAKGFGRGKQPGGNRGGRGNPGGGAGGGTKRPGKNNRQKMKARKN
ncbi:probable rRNA-processing protein EBP2 homolog [Folsomia candida]|uniref:Putative rRNA-processing protein EBP2 n=1 Tax=Folsomia candida TaxID=158441 RepID=A0A226EJ29_FOLCA|nr:probable rRNA-processing protein EBP2 homolog [Folsomia candida]OXA57300.1 putative rRNA-processing protein EBP2 [Folsomia candida]